VYNIIFALLMGAVVALAVSLKFSWVAAIAPTILVMLVGYVVLARKTAKKLEGIADEVEKHLGAGRTEQAVKALEALRPLGRWQLGVESAIDTQVGMIYYAHKKDFDKAVPYLEKAPQRAWQAKAMLGAQHYRKKRYPEMAQVFEQAVKKNPKASLLWATYAWCEWKRNEAQSARQILDRALKPLPNDTKLKANAEALAEKKKMKMKPYGAEWLAMHLEAPPVQRGMQGNAWPPGAWGRRGKLPR
jgi:tetratricopeptide (TPR) repeat protein